MPQLAISAAGAAVGFAVAGPTGAQWGWMLGGIAGASLFGGGDRAPKADLRAPKVQLGATMPRIYGTVRIALSPRWQSAWNATASSSGGKGGGGSETNTYSCDLLAWVSDVAGLPDALRLAGWARLWWNGELVATRLVDSGLESIEVSGGGRWSSISFYDGGPAQLPWPVYETALGAENADAHRGVACFGIEGLQVGTWTNLPLLEAEVYTNGTETTLEELAAPQVGAWGLDGSSMPAHSAGDSTYTDIVLMEGAEIDSTLVPGSFSSLSAAMAAIQAVMPDYTGPMFWSTSVNHLPNLFSDGATLPPLGDEDDPEWCYIYIGPHPIIWQTTGWPTDTPVEDPPYASPSVGLIKELWTNPSVSLARGPARVVYSTFAVIPPEHYTQTANHLTSYPSTKPYPYFPTVVTAPMVRITVRRVPFVPNGYTIESGTFKQLSKVAYSLGKLTSNGIGPALRSTDPDYNDESFWEAAAAEADLPGDYGVDWPVVASETGVRSVEAVELGTVDLADIVSAECLLAPGIVAGDIDVTELEGIPVRGFVAQGSPRQSIEELMGIYQFYAVCSDKVYFRLLDAASIASIPHGDTGAGVDQAAASFTGLERGNDLEVPSEITIVSPNPSADYDAGAETSDRLVTAGRGKESIQSTVVLTPAERKGRANAMVMDARVGMHTARLSVDDNYAQIEPGDVVTVTDELGNGYTVRATREAYAQGVHDFEIRLFDRTVLTLEGTTSDTYYPVITIPVPADSDLLMLDTGLLRDEDDGLHLLAAVRPAESGRWSGAAVYRSVDDASFSSVASTSTRGVWGTASTALADFTGWVWDDTSTVTVNVGTATLASSTKEAMQADASINNAALGDDGRWEILRYRTATLVAPGIYTLSGFLRGLKGTESFRGTHTSSDTFIKLTTDTLERIGVSSSELGLDRYWRGVSFGQQVSLATSQTVSPDGIALKPWAPVGLEIERDGGNDATITWHGRSRRSIRFGGPGGTYVQADATLIGYRVRVYEDDTFAVVVRTEDTTDSLLDYTAAEQTSDGLTPGDPISVRITQLSTVVGEGYILEGTA